MEWTAEFRARYAEWWPQAEPLLAAHDYSAAFKTYPWPTFADTPWTPVAKALGQSRIAVVTTGEAPSESFDGGGGFVVI